MVMLTSVLLGVAAGIIYSLAGYAKNRAEVERVAEKIAGRRWRDVSAEELLALFSLQPDFSLKLFLQTLVQGAVIGFVAGALGIQLDLAANLLMNVGVLTLVRKAMALILK